MHALTHFMLFLFPFLFDLIHHPNAKPSMQLQLTSWHQQTNAVGLRSLKVKLCSVFTPGRESCLLQLFHRRQQKRGQAAVALTAALNAAMSRSGWMREQSDNWWELLVGAGDLSVNAVTFLSFGCHSPTDTNTHCTTCIYTSCHSAGHCYHIPSFSAFFSVYYVF